MFCKSIGDTAKVYGMFVRELAGCHREIVNMYHSCTLPNIKEKIRANMNDIDGSLHILICTNAAGMGVDFKGVQSVVNYGPPQELDTLIQQLGRSGRDGSQSLHILFYKKQQMRNVNPDLLTYLRNNDNCRRLTLCETYSSKPIFFNK